MDVETKKFTKALSDELKRARGDLGLTQEDVAEQVGIDPASIIKMENSQRNANPRLSTLYPVIRALNINPQIIFYPELYTDNPHILLLQQIISDCSDEEADTLIPIVRELKSFMRKKDRTKIS